MQRSRTNGVSHVTRWVRPLGSTCLAAGLLCAPARAQPDAATSAWARAIDDYLAGRRDRVAETLRGVPPADVRTQAREALDAWLTRARVAGGGPKAAEERRFAIRRVQASAVLPLEIVSAISTRTRVGSIMDPYQDVAIHAWERLAVFEQSRLDPDAAGRASRGEDRTRLQHFRTWWRIGVLQYLVNTGRYRDFARQADQVRLSPDDRTMRAEFHFLQGMVEEHASRSATVADRDRNADKRVPGSRLRDVALTQDAAAREYRRALAAVPAHAEARLHLGRVLLERKQPDEAIDTLAPLLGRACESTDCALAALFTGEAHDGRGEPDKAAAAYARASSRQELRQSALVALAQLMVRRGDARGGGALLGHFADAAPLARREGPDAWAAYLGGRRQNIDAVLAPLREAMLP